METWLDTEIRAILHRSPPRKPAPVDTVTFALVLLAIHAESSERVVAAVDRILAATREEAAIAVTGTLPRLVQKGLSYEDAVLGQFELIACDAVSVFLADDVVSDAPVSYLTELYADLLHSPEFSNVSIRIESVPADEKGKDFLDRFLGAVPVRLPLELTVMAKKARIMEHWAAKIGGCVTLVGAS